MTLHKIKNLNSILTATGNAYIRWLCHVVDFSGRKAGFVLLLAAIITCLSILYVATHFSISTNSSDLIAKDLPFQQRNVKYVNAFPQLHETITVVIQGDTSGLVTRAADTLSAWLRSRPKEYSFVYQPGGGKFFAQNGLLYLSAARLQDLSDKLSQTQPLIARLTQDPSLRGLFDLLDQVLENSNNNNFMLSGLQPVFNNLSRTINAIGSRHYYQMPWGSLIVGNKASSQQRLQFIMVKPVAERHTLRPYAASINDLRQRIESLNLNANYGVQVHLTGEAVLDNNQLRTVSTGISLATILAFCLVTILLTLGLRSWRVIAAVLITLIAGLIWTTAFALYFVGPFNLISISFAVLFLGLGVDFGIQFCVRYLEESRTNSQLTSVLHTTALRMGGGLTLAAFAAAASFYSFVPTAYAGIIGLGIIAGTGIFIALFAYLTVLPSLLVSMRIKPSILRNQYHFNLNHLHFKRYAPGITIIAVIAGVLSIPLVLRTHFDFNPLHLQNPKSEGVETFHKLLAESKYSPYTIDILEPNLNSAKRVAARINHVRSVARVITLDSFIPDNQAYKLNIIRQMSITFPPFTLLPSATIVAPSIRQIENSINKFRSHLERTVRNIKRPDLRRSMQILDTALSRFQNTYRHSPQKYALLQQRVIGTLPEELARLHQLFNAEPVTLASLPTDLRDQYLSADGQARIQVFSSLNLNATANMQRFVNDVKAVSPAAIGISVMMVEGGNAVISAFRQATITAIVLIAIMLLLVLRNLRDTLLVLAPLGLACLLTSATMELAGISYNLANIIVLPLLVGLGIAYGIYLILRWRDGTDINKVMRSSTPVGIFFSALTTMSTFGSLAVASDPAVSMLGITLSIALGWVLVCTLIVLPAVLTLFNYDHRRSSTSNNHA